MLEEVLAEAVASVGAGSVRRRPRRCPRICRPCSATRRCSSGRSRTSSPTPSPSPAGATSASWAGRVRATVDVRVVDRGPGVPPEEREQIFLPFRRLGRFAAARRRGARSRHRQRVRGGDGRYDRGGRHAGRRLDHRGAAEGGDHDTRPGRRRRAADPPRAQHQPAGARLRGRSRARAANRRSSSRRAPTRTSSCSISACPASTASR